MDLKGSELCKKNDLLCGKHKEFGKITGYLKFSLIKTKRKLRTEYIMLIHILHIETSILAIFYVLNPVVILCKVEAYVMFN